MLSSLLPVAAVGAGVGGVGFWWNKRRQKGPSLEERFESWIESSDDVSRDLKAWIGELSQKDRKALLNLLVLHCAELEMELDWLFGEEAFNQELRSALQQSVLAYLHSRMAAARAFEDAQAFKVYQAFDNKPKKHQEFGRLLYTKLVDHGVIAVSTSNLLEQSNKKRTQYIISSIRQSASDQPAAFHQALKAVVREMAAANKAASKKAEPAPEPTPEPAPIDEPEEAEEN